MTSVANLGYQSTTHRVLEIPEIIELIFSFTDKRSKTVNACVCKRWSAIALSMLWRDVDDLRSLLRLLAPLAVKQTDFLYYYFSRRLEPEDWARLSPYARRVRKLVHNELEGTAGHERAVFIRNEAFDEVARTRTALNILPNLTTLEWYVPTVERMRQSVLFMHDNVKRFKVHLPATDEPVYGSFFKDIVARMPSLTHLDLRFSFSVNKIKTELITLFEGLQRLQTVILPLFCITSDMIEALSRLPDVGTIQFEFMEEQGIGHPDDVMKFSPTLESGAFPSLWDLSLSARLSDMTRFLNMKFAPNNLTSLYIHVLAVSTPSVFTDFLVAVSENCHLLASLYIDLAMRENPMAPPISKERLTFENIRPLLDCPNLSTFELRWNLPLSISMADIETIASKWPSLEVLILNCEPMPFSAHNDTDSADPATSPLPLTLRAILPFARHCPRIRELGLYMNATAEDIFPSSPTEVLPAFQKLQRLQVGLSRTKDHASVALFLSQILPLGCEVRAGLSWPEGLGVFFGQDSLLSKEEEEEMSREVMGWCKRWEDVQETLPLLTRLRMDERARRRVLEREVEDLRMRCKVLEERAKLGMRRGSDGTCVAL